MSEPIIPDNYTILLNEANEFKFDSGNLRPGFIGFSKIRVLCSNENVILSITAVRDGYLANGTPRPTLVPGICVPSVNTWYDCNSQSITQIKATVFQHANPQPDSYSIGLQFQ